MKIQYLETTLKVYNENRDVINMRQNEETELIPDEGKALLNIKTNKKYIVGHVISRDETPTDYIEVEVD